jgi:hypothetical protein
MLWNLWDTTVRGRRARVGKGVSNWTMSCTYSDQSQLRDAIKLDTHLIGKGVETSGLGDRSMLGIHV